MEFESNELGKYANILKRVGKVKDAVTVKEIPLHKELPDWSLMTLRNANVVILRDLSSRSQLKLSLEPYYATETSQIKIATFPFANGATQLSYHAHLFVNNMWKPYIVQSFFRSEDNENVQLFLERNEQSKIAMFFAERWNQIKNHSDKRIKYIETRILELVENGKKIYFNFEEFVEGDWQKWSNNAGFVDADANELLRFSKWTHEYSNGYVMVTNLEGVELFDKYVLSDPALLCADETRFKSTNLSSVAQIQICLESIEHALRPISDMSYIEHV